MTIEEGEKRLNNKLKKDLHRLSKTLIEETKSSLKTVNKEKLGAHFKNQHIEQIINDLSNTEYQTIYGRHAFPLYSGPLVDLGNYHCGRISLMNFFTSNIHQTVDSNLSSRVKNSFPTITFICMLSGKSIINISPAVNNSHSQEAAKEIVKELMSKTASLYQEIFDDEVKYDFFYTGRSSNTGNHCFEAALILPRKAIISCRDQISHIPAYFNEVISKHTQIQKIREIVPLMRYI